MNERRLIAKHALTVWVGQIAVMAFGVTDTVVAGRYAESALAALSVGSAIYISVFVTLMGVLQATLPMFSELNGAGRPRDMGRLLRQAIYIWLANCAVGMALLMNASMALEWTQVPTELRPVIEHYLEILAWALPAALWFRLYANLNQALGRPKAVTWVQVLGLACKIPLSILFTFGLGPMTGWGLIGCAYATLVVNMVMALFSVLALVRGNYRGLYLWRKMEAPHPRKLIEMLRLGLPNAASITVEVTSYTLMALLIARLGSQAAASHQITSNLGALLYMVPLSLSIATSARVSYWIGAARPEMARAAIFHGFYWLLINTLASGLILAMGRHVIARLYIQDEAVAGPTGDLLVWLVWYQTVDALQVLCFFVLRCYRVTLLPMLVYATFLWGVGLSGGYWLAYEGGWGIEPLMGPQAFWISSSLALTIVSAVLGGLLYVVIRRQPRH
ncbi:MAG: MATE family efflux transporter [Alphaproteobacteria bacterium]|nr:MATE family efflux transporter [Alphaproteobacteria bacterium]